MYYKKYPPLEKEYKEERRMDKLKYPWDYTTENIYRPATKKYGATKKKYKQNNDKDKKDLEPPPGPFPEYDPMGVYTQRPKRQHKGLEEFNLKNKYDDMNLHQKLATIKAKVQAMPKWRDASQDVELALQGLSTPLPKSQVAGKEMYTVEGYEEYDDYRKSGLEGSAATKVKQSKDDLLQFECMLLEKFGRKKEVRMHEILARKLNLPPPPPLVRYDFDEEQVEYVLPEPIGMQHVCFDLHLVYV